MKDATSTEQPLTAVPLTSIRVGVSACLLGERVRYDGGHKLDRYISDTLGRFFTFLPVCPRGGVRPDRSPVRPCAWRGTRISHA